MFYSKWDSGVDDFIPVRFWPRPRPRHAPLLKPWHHSLGWKRRPAVPAVAARGQPRGSGPTALGRAPRSPSDSAPAASGRPVRAQRWPIGPFAPDQLLGSRGRTEAASSAAGCGADPGDEMTTSTLQVPRRGPARLTEAEGSAVGPAGGRAASS